VSHQLQVRRIGQVEHVLRAAQECHEAGRLLEQAAQMAALGVELQAGLLDALRSLQHARFHLADVRLRRRCLPQAVQLGNVDRVLQHVHDIAVLAGDRRVGRAPEAILAVDAVGDERQGVGRPGRDDPLE